MDLMNVLLVVWIALTVVLVVLLIYKSTLTIHEDDQLFLGNSEAHMQKEQEEVISRMNKLTPWLRVCGAGSALLILIYGGMQLFTHMTR